MLGAVDAEVNVSTIVKEAKLSRSSFYSQFKDVGDIAVQLIGELLTELLVKDARMRAEKRFSNDEITRTSIDYFLSKIDERRNLYASLFGGGADASAQVKVCDMMMRLIQPAFVEIPPSGAHKDFDAEFAARFLGAGALANIIAWVTSDDPLSVEQVRQRLIALMPPWAAFDG